MTATIILALIAFTIGVFIAAVITFIKNIYVSVTVKDEDLEWDSLTQTWQLAK